MKLITFTQARMINQIKSDPAMHVMVLISLKTVMKQCALGANLILIIICHLNSLRNATPTDNLATIVLITITMVMGTKQINTPNHTYNFQFWPTNQTKWLNCWKTLERWWNISNGHLNIVYHTLIILTIVKATQAHLTWMSKNSNLITTRMK